MNCHANQESTYASDEDTCASQDMATEDEVESIVSSSSYSSRALSPPTKETETEKVSKPRRIGLRPPQEPVVPEEITLRGHKFEKVPQKEDVSSTVFGW